MSACVIDNSGIFRHHYLMTLTRIILTVVLAVACLGSPQSFAQSMEYSQNLQICLQGIYPGLCNYRMLTPEHLKQVRLAEYRSNLQLCMQGTTPSLCNHKLLIKEHLQEVLRAEYRANLSLCLQGAYPYLCNHQILTKKHLNQVVQAEYRANLKLCLQGIYRNICNHGILSKEHKILVAQAEARAPYIMPVPSVPTNSYDVSGYSYRNGSYIHGSIDSREGSKSVDGYIYDSAGNSIYVEGEWTGNGEVEVYDSQGNSYELEVD